MSYLLLRIKFLILVVSRILLLAVRGQKRTYLKKRFRKKRESPVLGNHVIILWRIITSTGLQIERLIRYLEGIMAYTPRPFCAFWKSESHTPDMLKRWCCWSGRPSKSKGFGVINVICRCAFVVGWREICFRLL